MEYDTRVVASLIVGVGIFENPAVPNGKGCTDNATASKDQNQEPKEIENKKSTMRPKKDTRGSKQVPLAKVQVLTVRKEWVEVVRCENASC